MAKLSLKAGTTSQTLYVFLQDSASATGAGKTGLAFNTAGLTCYYVRPRAAAAAVTLATQTVTGAWSSGGFVEVDATNAPGLYRFDPPDAACAAGAADVVFFFKGTGVAPLLAEVELTATDNQNATTGGLGNLDAAVSSRSSYAGGDTAGTTTLLARLTSGRAANLDNLDAAVSTRSTLAAAGVWDLATTGHTAAGTFGSAMNAAGGAGDPWATLLPGAYGAGTAGNILGSRLDAAVGTRLAASALSADGSGRVTLAPAGLDAVAVEAGVNARQALSVIASACAGVLSGAATTSVAIAAAGNSGTNRIAAAVDSSGNRTSVTLNLP
jgi:hypothetical protein